MTLRELILSVDPESFSRHAIYQKLRVTKPEYGTNRSIEVRQNNGQLVITNTHIGSLGDLLTYPVVVSPDLHLSNVQLFEAILRELSSNDFSLSDESDFWNDLTNLQKAKIVR